MATTEATRWVMEHVDHAKNMSRFYIIYVVPMNGVTNASGNRLEKAGAVEVRHWGRRGTTGRFESFWHDDMKIATESANQKAYAELGKGYKQIVHDTFPFNPQSNKVEPPSLHKAASKHVQATTEMGLTNSELDRFTRKAQTLLVTLQDPQTSLDIDAVAEIKQAFHAIEEQYGRASATVKMIDLVCAARLEKVGV